MTEIVAYPLCWPFGWKRTAPGDRRSAQFFAHKERARADDPSQRVVSRERVGVALGVERIIAELGRFGIPSYAVIVSSNVKTRVDGLPRAGQAEPEDPGVAVYWKDGANQRVMAIDRYDRVADNLSAIARTIEAMRTIERHGGAVILDRAFSGFTALPPPMTAQKPWRSVLGFDERANPEAEVVETYYRRARSSAHPDRGGSQERFLAVQAAYEAAARELGFPV